MTIYRPPTFKVNLMYQNQMHEIFFNKIVVTKDKVIALLLDNTIIVRYQFNQSLVITYSEEELIMLFLRALAVQTKISNIPYNISVTLLEHPSEKNTCITYLNPHCVMSKGSSNHYSGFSSLGVFRYISENSPYRDKTSYQRMYSLTQEGVLKTHSLGEFDTHKQLTYYYSYDAIVVEALLCVEPFITPLSTMVEKLETWLLQNCKTFCHRSAVYSGVTINNLSLLDTVTYDIKTVIKNYTEQLKGGIPKLEQLEKGRIGAKKPEYMEELELLLKPSVKEQKAVVPVLKPTYIETCKISSEPILILKEKEETSEKQQNKMTYDLELVSLTKSSKNKDNLFIQLFKEQLKQHDNIDELYEVAVDSIAESSLTITVEKLQSLLDYIKTDDLE